jgi:Ni/Co efflux regulator RcnB
MKSRSLVCAVAAASLAFSSLSFAQGYDRDRGDGSHRQAGQYRDRDARDADRRVLQRQDDRRDRREARRDYRQGYRADYYHYGARGPEWRRGGRIPAQYRSHQYVVNDWRGHRLHAPPRGYHWVQVGGDYVLAAIATGIILQLMLSQ